MHGMSFLGEQGAQEDVYLIRSRFGSTCSMPHPTSFSQSRQSATVMRSPPVIGRSQFPRSPLPTARQMCISLDACACPASVPTMCFWSLSPGSHVLRSHPCTGRSRFPQVTTTHSPVKTA